MSKESNSFETLVAIDGRFHIILHHLVREYEFELRGENKRDFYIDTAVEEISGSNDVILSKVITNPIELLKRYPGIINKRKYLPEYFHPTLDIIEKFNSYSTDRYFLLFYEPKWGWFLAQINSDLPNRTMDCDILEEISKVLNHEVYSIGLFDFSINDSEDQVYPVIRFNLPIHYDNLFYKRGYIRKNQLLKEDIKSLCASYIMMDHWRNFENSEYNKTYWRKSNTFHNIEKVFETSLKLINPKKYTTNWTPNNLSEDLRSENDFIKVVNDLRCWLDENIDMTVKRLPIGRSSKVEDGFYVCNHKTNNQFLVSHFSGVLKIEWSDSKCYWDLEGKDLSKVNPQDVFKIKK